MKKEIVFDHESDMLHESIGVAKGIDAKIDRIMTDAVTNGIRASVLAEEIHKSMEYEEILMLATLELSSSPYKQINEEYLECYYEVVREIEARSESIEEYLVELGQSAITGKWELAKGICLEFVSENKDRAWDGDFFDTIDEFLNKRLAQYHKNVTA